MYFQYKILYSKMYLFYLKSLFVYLINHIKDEVSLIHPLWKIECNLITIHKHTHFIFLLESLSFSLYNNILIWCQLIMFARKTTTFGNPIFWQNLKILTPQIFRAFFFSVISFILAYSKYILSCLSSNFKLAHLFTF